jgi:hypothetical protein
LTILLISISTTNRIKHPRKSSLKNHLICKIMKKIKPQFIVLILYFFSSSINAQEAVLTSGGNAGNATGSVSYSLGQVAYVYASASNGSLSSGVQQPYEISTLGINDFPEITLQMSVYPNPTSTNVILKIQDLNSQNFNYQLLDGNGKIISNDKVNNSETSISLENLAASIYFLTVLENNKSIKNFKIIKN